MATIAIVALIVFGPQRLPEIARKAGKALRELRTAAAELTTGLEAEYAETLEPLDEARRAVRSALDEIDLPADRPRGGESVPETGCDPAPAPADEPDRRR